MKPLAQPTPDTREWFALIDEGRLTVPRCRECRAFFLYPRSSCPRCGHRAIELVDAAGTGTLLSFVINHRGPEGFVPPYALAIVELAEGPHLMGTLRAPDLEAVEVGTSVRVAFEQRGDRRVVCFDMERAA
ncbi:Zn-ribbon domain-containing OB-fold protein [Microbacterium koreense]|uniref:Zn-ribbon domain-containing OB-fold protein n=1 Tax=Microbacterium koreense TaxID=323761 RepID=A0ABW2ZPY8_9MICO